MSKQVTKPNLYENVHKRGKLISTLINTEKRRLSDNNFKLLCEYDDDLIIDGLSINTQYKNLTHFGLLSSMVKKDWVDVTEADLRKLVGAIMAKHGDNGKETNYTYVLKISLRGIVRFAKTNSRKKPENGELDMLKFLTIKQPKDKLTREDLPTDQDVQKILDACSDSSRDKALLAVHIEASTRIGEVLSRQIKDFVIDEYGGMLKVDGKTGVRPIRIVKSVPYLTRWINDHPFRDDPNSPMWVYTHRSDTFGRQINYPGFYSILRKRIKQSGISKRTTSHLFRHKGITDLANKLTESESRMRHGWGKNSSMPSRYTHLNQEDLDEKMLTIMGIKSEKKQEDPIKECAFCHIKYPVETRFCNVCSRPLDVTDAMQMEREHEERTKALVLETLRQEHASKSKSAKTKKLEEENQRQQNEIAQLKKLLKKVSS